MFNCSGSTTDSDLPDGSSFYFVHGYHVVPKDDAIIATTTDYGRPFVSSIRKANLFATHPPTEDRIARLREMM